MVLLVYMWHVFVSTAGGATGVHSGDPVESCL